MDLNHISMLTPHEIRQYIEELESRSSPATEEEARTLLELLILTLPSTPEKGKTCPNCQRKCYCACKVCPHCHVRLKPKARRTPPEPPEPPPLAENDCEKCARPMTDEEKFTLQCGCSYHKECLRRKAREPIASHRKCFCKKPGCQIPGEFFPGGVNTSRPRRKRQKIS